MLVKRNSIRVTAIIQQPPCITESYTYAHSNLSMTTQIIALWNGLWLPWFETNSILWLFMWDTANRLHAPSFLTSWLWLRILSFHHMTMYPTPLKSYALSPSFLAYMHSYFLNSNFNHSAKAHLKLNMYVGIDFSIWVCLRNTIQAFRPKSIEDFILFYATLDIQQTGHWKIDVAT